MRELLCIKSHPSGACIAGNTYPLIRTSDGQIDACGCSENCVDIGAKDPSGWSIQILGGEAAPMGFFGKCITCKKRLQTSDTHWLCKSRFVEIATEEEVEQEMKIEKIVVDSGL